MTQEERFNLLKNACEEALKHDPEVLEGKKIVYTENSGKSWKTAIFHDFKYVPEKEVRICISPMYDDQYCIIISKNMRWRIAAEYISENIKEKDNDILISPKSLSEDTLGIIVTF